MGLQKPVFGVIAVVFFMAVCVSAQTPAAAPSPSSDCMSQISTLAPCLSYVMTPTNQTKPDTGCCPALAAVVASNATCLCMILDPKNSQGIPLNMTRAMGLPGVCKVQTPPLSQCGTSLASPTGSPAASPVVSPAASPATSPVVSPAVKVPASSPTVSPAGASPIISPSMSPAMSPSSSPTTPAPAILSPVSDQPTSSPAPASSSETPTPSTVAPESAVPSASSPTSLTPSSTSPTPSSGSTSSPASSASPPTPASSTSPPSPPSSTTPLNSPVPSPAKGSSSAASVFTPSVTILTLAALALAAIQF